MNDKNNFCYDGEYGALAARRITDETCRRWGYRIKFKYRFLVGKDEWREMWAASATFKRSGRTVYQKLRSTEKHFASVGDIKEAGLYGQHLWGQGGKKLVITEGELDAMSVSQLQDHKWAVVSIPNGVDGAVKAISREIEWVESFEQVIFMFDMDEVGQEAATKCAELLSPGKARIASLPLKDANECLVAGRGVEVQKAIWDAKVFRPDGIITFREALSLPTPVITRGHSWFIPELNEWTYGRRGGETTYLAAGGGIGKTDFITEQMAYDVNELDIKIGVLSFEQDFKETLDRIAGKVAGKLFHLPPADGGWTEADRVEALAKLDCGSTIYNHRGATEWDIVKQRINYMAVSEEAQVIYLDNLTALYDPDDLTVSVEKIVRDLTNLAVRHNIHIHIISHLTTPDGKPHEEGGRVFASQFKGSRRIIHEANYMFGIERDPQSKNEEKKKVAILRCLKDRKTGTATGKTLYLGYDPKTGRQFQAEAPKDGCPFNDETEGSDY